MPRPWSAVLIVLQVFVHEDPGRVEHGQRRCAVLVGLGDQCGPAGRGVLTARGSVRLIVNCLGEVWTAGGVGHGDPSLGWPAVQLTVCLTLNACPAQCPSPTPTTRRTAGPSTSRRPGGGWPAGPRPR